MTYRIPPPPPLDRLTTALATALVALVLALPTAVMAQNSCSRSTCAATIKNVSAVADGCGNHATPARMSITWGSSRSVTYNQGKTGRYATLFPPRTVNNVLVDPADETRIRSNLPLVTFVVPSTEPEQGGDFTDWEWRSPNLNRGTWQPGSAGQFGVASQIGEHIFEVRPKAGARIWSNAGEVVLQSFRLNDNNNLHVSGRARLLFMGGKGCARVNHAGQTDGTIQ